MDNDPFGPASAQDEGRVKKGRLMGKFFKGNRDRKVSNEQRQGELDAFLHGPTDTLKVNHPAPPTLAKLDISNATRYPNALDVQNSQRNLSVRSRTRTPQPRRRKGLVVRFVDTFPEIIGEGGDTAEEPVASISTRKRAKSSPAPANVQRPTDLSDQSRAYSDVRQADESFRPGMLRRAQTGYESVSDGPNRAVPAGQPTPAPFLEAHVVSKDENRRSFIEVQQAQQRQAEGLAFAQAVRSASVGAEEQADGPRPPSSNYGSPTRGSPPPITVDEAPGAGGQNAGTQPQRTPQSSPRLPMAQPFQSSPQPSPQASPRPPIAQLSRPSQPDVRLRTGPFEQSPISVQSASSNYNHPYAFSRQNSKLAETPISLRKGASTAPDASDDALSVFTARTRHLFELFRLHSETLTPLLSCTAEILARAALWWFLKGRTALETAIRERPTSPQSQNSLELTRQQAYADLAKSYWLSEEVLPETLDANRSPVDGEVEEVRRAILANLRKLAGSMQRNGFLPDEEALLPQAIEKSIWIEYPSLSRDVVALLWGSRVSALAASQALVPPMTILEALPVGDTPKAFAFGRVPAEVFLMEQNTHSQDIHLPCFLSMVRSQDQANLSLVIASQDGTVQLQIQSKKAAGTTWDDIRWRKERNSLDVTLPRNLMLAVHLAPQDFKLLWSMYDFGAKVQTTLYPRDDEKPIYHTTLRAFQYFDSDPNSRQFPKESVPNCDIGLFERVIKEGAATGPRHFHRGYRIAVVTGTMTRTMCGVNHAYVPRFPVQFGFLRGDQGDPALLLGHENGRARGTMVLTFHDEEERAQLHSLLVGTALRSGEDSIADIPLVSVNVSKVFSERSSIPVFQKLAAQRVRIINDTNGTAQASTVLSDNLRMIVEFKNGTITDRINVAPGEFKIRLGVKDVQTLTVLRQPQQDMSIAIADAQLSREVPAELADALTLIQQAQTCRTFEFANLQDLHAFEAALTGHQVLFDGIATTFAISRRRMMVPIYKKWEAGATRIQVVQQDNIVQLLAFFEDYHHGHSMSFVLKGTDVFETFGRSGKAGLKIDDAKFPLPRLADEGGAVNNDAAFVCLDMPELPGEHDDITILFDSDKDRDRFASCLPAPVKGSRFSKRF